MWIFAVLSSFLHPAQEYALSSDSSLVRLAIPMNRHTIILRDVPEEATKEDILHLVDNPAVNLRKEVDSIWFVDYPTESRLLKPSTVFRTPRCWDPLSGRV